MDEGESSSKEIQISNIKYFHKKVLPLNYFGIPLSFACLRLPAGRQGRQELCHLNFSLSKNRPNRYRMSPQKIPDSHPSLPFQLNLFNKERILSGPHFNEI